MSQNGNYFLVAYARVANLDVMLTWATRTEILKRNIENFNMKREYEKCGKTTTDLKTPNLVCNSH